MLYPVLICAGISLFGISTFWLVSLTLTDMLIFILIIYALVKNRIFFRGIIFYIMAFFTMIALLSGFINAITDYSTFATNNFIANYFRIVGLFGMVSLFPPLQNKIGHTKLAIATLWIVRMHALFVLADAFFTNPFDWSGSEMMLNQRSIDFNRPRGLFVEPSFFGIYTGLSLFYILQVQCNTKKLFFKPLDLLFIGLAMIASTSASAVILFLFFLFEYFRTQKKSFSFKRLGSLILLFLVATSLGNQFQKETSTGINLQYVINKVSHFRYGFKDENIRVRILGGFILSNQILQKSPLLGIGLGGENQNRFLSSLGVLYEGKITSEDVLFGPGSVMPISVFIATGLLGTLLYILIFIFLLVSSKSNIIGKSLIAVWFMWGNVFAPMIWWYVTSGISFNYKKKLT